MDGALQDGYVSVPDAEIREVQYVFQSTDAAASGSSVQGMGEADAGAGD